VALAARETKQPLEAVAMILRYQATGTPSKHLEQQKRVCKSNERIRGSGTATLHIGQL